MFWASASGFHIHFRPSPPTHTYSFWPTLISFWLDWRLFFVEYVEWLDIIPRTWCINGLRLSSSSIAVRITGFRRRRVLVLSMLYKSRSHLLVWFVFGSDSSDSFVSFCFLGGLRSYRLGVPSRLVIFPDENHWVLNHGNRCVGLFFRFAHFLLFV